MNLLRVFVISDSVGETGELVAKAAVSQYLNPDQNVSLKRFPYIDSIDQVRDIIHMAADQQAFVVYTLVSNKLRDFIVTETARLNVTAVDLMGPLLDALKVELNAEPLEEAGLVRKLDDDYFKKVEAIEFAVKYDDGRDPRGILMADIVLVGISRTSKTPLSQYLAHKRLKVANVPLVPEVDPPEELFRVAPEKCFGLVISPEKLNNIRKERLIALGLNDDANYAKIQRIHEEIIHFNKVVEKIDCEVIDVTNRAVEETANLIMSKLK